MLVPFDPTSLLTSLGGGLAAAGTGVGWLIHQLLSRIDRNQASYEATIKENQATYKQTLEKVCSTFSAEVAKCHEERAKTNTALLELMTNKEP